MADVRINPHIFRAYDIRGLAGDEFTPQIGERIGRAFGTYVQRQFQGRRVVVGRDGRPSSPALYYAVIAGLCATGIEVTAIGLAPTPVMYFAVAEWGLDGGISITASHNPVEFNGAKLVREEGRSLLPDEIRAVHRIVESGEFLSGAGHKHPRDPKPEYLALLRDRFPLARPLRIVVDPGNGVSTLTGPQALRAAGAEVIGLYTALLDGFPNHLPDPQDPAATKALAQKVVEVGADLGIAWDGDGDRVGAVDEQGNRREADWLVAIIARDVLQRHPGARILLDLKSSRSALQDVRAHGGEPVLTETGYSLVKQRMRDEGVLFGGEASGHIMFGEDYPCLDDGVYAACVIAHILAADSSPFSAHFEDMQPFVTSPELKLLCADDEKFAVARDIAANFRGRYPVIGDPGARVDFGEGWALIRASNTGPYLSLRVEASTRAHYDRILAEILQAIRAYPQLEVPSGFGTPLP